MLPRWLPPPGPRTCQRRPSAAPAPRPGVALRPIPRAGQPSGVEEPARPPEGSPAHRTSQ
eukprot:2700945-Lingulodinium_polyedra.AAC.1